MEVEIISTPVERKTAPPPKNGQDEPLKFKYVEVLL